MKEHDTPDPEFIKGFNEGYTLAKHLPDLAEQLGAVNDESQRGSGFQAGQRQLFVERQQERYPAWLRGDYAGRADGTPDIAPNKDIDLDR